MSESMRKKIIAVVMVLAIGWGYHNLKPGSKPKTESSRPVAAAVQTAAPKPASAEPPRLINIEQEAAEPWGKDPFRVVSDVRTADKRPYPKPQWQLSGILYNEQAPAAVINKQQVRVGDTVDEARVLEIKKKSVTLEHNGKQMTITVTKG